MCERNACELKSFGDNVDNRLAWLLVENCGKLLRLLRFTCNPSGLCKMSKSTPKRPEKKLTYCYQPPLLSCLLMWRSKRASGLFVPAIIWCEIIAFHSPKITSQQLLKAFVERFCGSCERAVSIGKTAERLDNTKFSLIDFQIEFSFHSSSVFSKHGGEKTFLDGGASRFTIKYLWGWKEWQMFSEGDGAGFKKQWLHAVL